MSESKFTPGPWEADDTTVKTGRHTIASVYDPDDTCHRTNIGLANARLIASAPDMYEALKALIYRAEEQWPYKNTDVNKAIEYAQAVIAKAKGKV